MDFWLPHSPYVTYHVLQLDVEVDVHGLDSGVASVMSW